LTLIFQDQKIAACGSSYRVNGGWILRSNANSVGAAEGCDLLTLIFQDQKIAACGSSYRGEWRMRILRSNANSVGAAEGCDLLTLIFQDQKIAACGSLQGDRVTTSS
jgi:hypothetical protein